MAKYLLQASYTAEGGKALLKEGGSRRREAVEQALKSLDGKLDAFYYAFGDADVFAIVDLPDHASAMNWMTIDHGQQWPNVQQNSPCDVARQQSTNYTQQKKPESFDVMINAF